MSAATGIVARDKILSPYRPIGAFVKTGVTFLKGWALARDASGLLVVPTEISTLLPGGFADWSLHDAAAGDDTDEANAETGVFSVKMKSGDEFLASDKPAPIYFVNNNEFGKTASTRSIAGLFLTLDNDRPDTHCLAWIGPEGAAAAKALADAANIASSGTFLCHEFTNPLAASTTGLLDAGATTVADQVILAAAMKSGGKTELAARPRNVTVTGGGTTAHAATSCDLVGTDIDDAALLETIALTGGSGTGVKAFKTLTSATLKGATDTDATEALGFGVKMGFKKSIVTRAGRLAVIQEVAAGSIVTNGSFVSPATSPPHGTYAPNTAQDGANDYAVTFEQDLS